MTENLKMQTGFIDTNTQKKKKGTLYKEDVWSSEIEGQSLNI